MTYIMNPILRERPSIETANRADPSKVFDRARSIFNSARQTLGTKHDFAWGQFYSRTYGLGPDALLLLAQQAVEWALAREAEAKGIVAASLATQARAHEAKMATAAAGASRQTWANANLRPLWNLGAELAAIAAEIEATRGAAPSISNSFAADVPIATEDELAAFVATVKDRLSRTMSSLKGAK